jgi:cysteinyl-tRNA synthetase
MALTKSLRLYNTLSGAKETLVPRVEGQLSFYVCGVTVYDYCHLGHARAYVAFDCIRRYLEYTGLDVTFIQNFTDIDDKIIKRAAEKEMLFSDLTSLFIKAFHDDMDALNIKRATKYPHATKYVGEMIKMIKGLMDNGSAYQSKTGDVCFSIDACKDYGTLSKKVLEDLVAGQRVDVDLSKKNPLDFVLWKHSKLGEPSWKSPWGDGRPGWHIECSAMVLKELGEGIDIHAGGADLIFPHHENERAQSECFTGKKMANYWLHNGFVTIKNTKMSKSLDNFFTIRDILAEYSGEVVRFFLMKMHYRSQLNFSKEGLDEAAVALKRLHTTLLDVSVGESDPEYVAQFESLVEQFHTSMRDDFNYAEALGFLFDINKLVNVSKSGVAILRELGELLGLFFDIDTRVDISPEAQALIEARSQAKVDRKFDIADSLRDQLHSKFGLLLKDTADGVHVYKA